MKSVLVGDHAAGHTRSAAAQRFGLIAVVVAAVIVHDSIYYLGSSSASMVDVPYLLLRFGVGRALYTGLFALFVAWLLRIRRELIVT